MKRIFEIAYARNQEETSLALVMLVRTIPMSNGFIRSCHYKDKSYMERSYKFLLRLPRNKSFGGN